MCGIVGIFNTDPKMAKQVQLFNHLLYIDALRGYDSTGVHLVKNDGSEVQYKRGLDANTFLQTAPYANLIESQIIRSKILIGHNRAATRGSISDANAHPFSHEHITAVHNGFISNADYLVPTSPKFDVDSASIPYAMAALGEKEALEKIYGDFAIVWYNNKDGTLNFARNKGRPLVFCYLDTDTMVYGSELGMIYMAIDRVGLKITNKFYDTLPGTHYKFKAPKEYEKQTFAIREFTQTNYTESRWNNRSFGGAASHTTGTTTTDTCPATRTIGGSAGAAQPAGSGVFTNGAGVSPRIARQVERVLKHIDSIGEKNREQDGWPKNKKRAAQAAKGLVDFANLDLFDEIYVKMTSWEPYGKTQLKGRILGEWYNGSSEKMRVVMVNRTEEEFKNLSTQRNGYCYAVITNFKAKLATVKPKYLYVLKPGGAAKAFEAEHSVTHEPEQTVASFVKGPGGSLIELGRWAALTQQGCSCCTIDLMPDDAAKLVWYGDSPICKSCANDPELLNSMGLITRLN